MKRADYELAAEVFRRSIGTGPKKATLLAAAIALDEARAALRWAGDPDDQLLKDLATMQSRLEARAASES